VKPFRNLTAFFQILDKPLLRLIFRTALKKSVVVDRLQASVREKVLYVSVLQLKRVFLSKNKHKNLKHPKHVKGYQNSGKRMRILNDVALKHAIIKQKAE